MSASDAPARMEELAARVFLMRAGLCSADEYNAVLDELFLTDDANALLREFI